MGSQGTDSGLTKGYRKAKIAGVGVEAGAHPEREKGPRLGNPIQQIGAAVQWVTKKQPNLSGIQSQIAERKKQNAGARELTRRMGK